MMSFGLYLSDLRFYSTLFKKAGLRGVIACKRLPKSVITLLDKLGLSLAGKEISLNLEGYKHPIWMRYQSSDPKVLLQIFVEEEYACLKSIENAKLIVDCGANVGYSSFYFLERYPDAHVIAIEPDDDNFRMLEKNLAPYQGRVHLIKAGVWSDKVGLVICRGDYRDGRSWAIQVRESKPGETPDLLAVDLSTVLQESGFSAIDLLKMDIEGAEAVVFSKNHEGWLEKVNNMVIEVHGVECEKILLNAVSRYHYEISSSGELTVFEHIRAKGVVSSNC
jgi:FkbM family methyltransferase